MGTVVTPHSFRLRVNLSTNRFESDDEVIEVGRCSNGSALRLRSADEGLALKDSDRVSLLGGPFDSREEAENSAAETHMRLLHWAVSDNMGIDWGGGPKTENFSAQVMQAMATAIGAPVRQDRHGIDVYEHVSGTRFVGIRATGKATRSLETLRRGLDAAAPTMTRKEQLAAEIYTSHHFDTSPRSRFLTLMTSLEALLEPQERGTDAQAVVAALLRTVSDSSLSPSIKASMKGSIQWLRSESIGQAARRLVSTLLAGRKYDGKPPATFFGDIYEVRSGIVHRGAAPHKMLEIANNTQEFVRDILLASIAGARRTTSNEEIELAAYHRWCRRMQLAQEGSLEDWLSAERDLR